MVFIEEASVRFGSVTKSKVKSAMAKTLDILHPAQTISRQLFSLPETTFLVS